MQPVSAAFLKKSWRPAPARPRRDQRASSAQRPLGRRVLLGQRLGEVEELGDDLDREHAGDPALARRPPARTGSRPGAGRRARRASRRRARGPGPGGESGLLGHASRRRGRARRASRAAGARRRPERVGDLGAVELRPHLGGRLADDRRAAPPRGRCRATRISASRFSARSAPTKSSTNSSAGAISSSAGVAYWASLPPSRMTAIRSPILIASSMSWVTKRIVLRISAWRRRNSFCRRSRLIGSIAPNGSSISITGGSAASARATPTRCCWPPESCAG